jgi:hypothetical protein
MGLDPGGYPRASAYVASLPQGLASYPSCRVKRETCDELISRLVDKAIGAELPAPLQEILETGGRTVWIPEVVGNTLLLVARDVVFGTDERFLSWVKTSMAKLLRQPHYRMAMRAVSATHLASGVGKRWSAFHTGTWLTAAPISETNGRYRTTLSLKHPPGLYSGLLIEQLASVLLATVETSQPRNGRMVARQPSDNEAELEFSWDASVPRPWSSTQMSPGGG